MKLVITDTNPKTGEVFKKTIPVIMMLICTFTLIYFALDLSNIVFFSVAVIYAIITTTAWISLLLDDKEQRMAEFITKLYNQKSQAGEK